MESSTGSSMSKPLEGIQGILGSYVTSSQSPVASQPVPEPKQPLTPKPRKRQRARLGRPPGRSSQTTTSKEKATLRIDTQLMAEYREWSWEARCQLGELVERALADYRRRNR